jgi:hypothetical protein
MAQNKLPNLPTPTASETAAAATTSGVQATLMAGSLAAHPLAATQQAASRGRSPASPRQAVDKAERYTGLTDLPGNKKRGPTEGEGSAQAEAGESPDVVSQDNALSLIHI